MTITLEHSGWHLSLQPELGGSVLALKYDGVDVLRPSPAAAADPLDTSCFPLVPYANRIADGRFMFEGESYQLPRNAEGQDHPLHGVGWKRSWTVEASDAVSATLQHHHRGDENWPWTYTAEQRFSLGDDRFRVTLSVRNLDSRPMPAGLGFHPYFPATTTTRLRFDATRVWLADDAMLPTNRAPANHFADWSLGAAVVRSSLIDNAYEGWGGTATIVEPAYGLTLSAEETPFLHVFTPPGRDYFCCEPVTDLPNAINRIGMAALPPGGERGITMFLRV
jgi:aldose 1-epimerase